jgi:phospholipase C
MVSNSARRSARSRAAVLSAVAVSGVMAAMPVYSADPDAATDQLKTATPIKHVIVVIGENRSFDHVYGTYVPKSGDSILNLLSERIVRKNGKPGPNFAAARQFMTSGQTSYFISVNKKNKSPYTTLPAPTLGGAPNTPSTLNSPNPVPPFAGPNIIPQLAAIEPSLEPGDLFLLTTGATGAAGTTGPDARITNDTTLPNGPFQLTGPNLPYDSYTGDTAHRFYQMWQQSDCNIHNATEDNPTGCLNDLYPYVMTTYAGPTADKGGGTSMAFYNMQDEDAPLLKKLADEYTISDNYHQPGQGGTGIQHVFSAPATTSSGVTGTATPRRRTRRTPRSPTPIPSSAPTTNTRWTGASATAPTCSTPRAFCRSCAISIPCHTRRRRIATPATITC